MRKSGKPDFRYHPRLYLLVGGEDVDARVKPDETARKLIASSSVGN